MSLAIPPMFRLLSTAFFAVTFVLSPIELKSPAFAQVQTEQTPQSNTGYDDWIVFISEVGEYQVEVPGNITVSEVTTELAEGDILWKLIEANPEKESELDSELYMIAYGDLPQELLLTSDSTSILDRLSTTILAEANFDDEIELEEDLLYNEAETRLVIGTVDETTLAFTISLLEERVYVGLAFSDDRDRMKYFFDSFIFGETIEDEGAASVFLEWNSVYNRANTWFTSHR